MDFDNILEEIGEFGRYQKIKYYLLCLPVFFGAANSLSYVFTAGQQNYRCLIPECESPDTATFASKWLAAAIPGEIQLDGTFKINHCLRYRPVENSTASADFCVTPLNFHSETVKCDQWVFDQSNSFTIVQQWAVTCEENEWKLAFVGTMHFAGIIVGSLWMAFGDFFGRKITLIVSTFFMSLTGVGQALSTSYEMFVTFAFLNAIGISGIFPLAFVLGLEMVGRRKRGAAGIVCNYFYAIGVAVLGFTAWKFPHWVTLQLLISIPPMILFIYYWIVPESVRWLLSKNRNKEATKIIRKAAKVNNATLSDGTLNVLEDIEKEKGSKLTTEELPKGEIKQAVLAMITSRTMLIRIVILLYNFAINALVYFGLSLNSVSLSGNKHFNFILVSLVEIPGYYLGYIAIEKFGRVIGFTASMILCGVTCTLCGYAQIVWLQIALFLIGKLGITCSFSILYVHATEMMPTVIRSSCVGFFATMSRIGALASPFAPFLAKYYKPLPYIVFGVTAFLGGLSYLGLPETLNKKLPNTVDEAIRLGLNTEQDEEGEIPLKNRRKNSHAQ